MKVSLVVATGAHEGRVIPLMGAQFLIGRDPQCHLRPASPAISKVHCGVLVRDGRVHVKDFGSTNGTMVNGSLVQSAEVAVEDGASLQVGPLDFRVRIEAPVALTDGTPLPADSPETAAAIAAVKATTAAAKPAPKDAPRDATPAPAKPVAKTTTPTKPGTPPTKPGGSKVAPAINPPTLTETPVRTGPSETSEEDHDRIAALMLGMDDEGNGDVPDGSTIMDIPSPLAAGIGTPAKPDDKKAGEPKKAQTREEMSDAANDLLRKYMRRPK